jgi:hypothetical protein
MLKLMEVPDVYADAVIRNNNGELVFMSCYGRDTAVQQMFAAFSLKPSEGGLNAITLVSNDHACEGDDVQTIQHSASVSDRLTRLTGRLPRQNLFGNLIHAWIFDPVIRLPDMVSRSAWLLDVDLMNKTDGKVRLDDSEPDEQTHGFSSRAWELIRKLSPVPLQAHWQHEVLSQVSGLVEDLADCNYPPMGSVQAKRISIPNDFSEQISQLVRTRQLRLSESRVTT